MKMNSNEFSRYIVARVKHYALPILDEGDELVPCSRCRNFMVRPKQCLNCGDFICAECQPCEYLDRDAEDHKIDEWYYIYKKCPVCNRNLQFFWDWTWYGNKILKTCKKCLSKMEKEEGYKCICGSEK